MYVKLDLDQSLEGEFLIWTNKDHAWKRRIRRHSREIKPFVVDLDVTEVHLFHHDKRTLTLYTINVDPTRSLDDPDIYTTLHSHHHRVKYNSRSRSSNATHISIIFKISF